MFIMQWKHFRSNLLTVNKMANNVSSNKFKSWGNLTRKTLWNCMKCFNPRIRYILFSSFYLEVSFTRKLKLSIDSNHIKLKLSCMEFWKGWKKCTLRVSCIEILNLKIFCLEKKEIGTVWLLISVWHNLWIFKTIFS